ncbi:hypothetical protein HK405_009237, partial [Cladochytrium tenue]
MEALLGATREVVNTILDVMRSALVTDASGRVRLKDEVGTSLTGLAARMSGSLWTRRRVLRIAAACLRLLARELKPNLCGFKSAEEEVRRMADMSTKERERLKSRIPAPVAYAAHFWATLMEPVSPPFPVN